jgi:hypothetical protein
MVSRFQEVLSLGLHSDVDNGVLRTLSSGGAGTKVRR